jgi:hypothetical protein
MQRLTPASHRLAGMSSLPIDRAPQFRRGVSIGELRLKLPAMIDVAAASQRNVIVRPHGAGVAFIQLDDLKADKLAALAPAVFLILETSPGNFQAWAALPGNEDKEFARRLRKGTTIWVNRS